MNFKFNELKTLQAISYILDLEGGTIDQYKLMMLLYLTDVDLLVNHGVVLTGDKYIKTLKGIVLCELKNRINCPNLYDQMWSKYITFDKLVGNITQYSYPGNGELSFAIEQSLYENQFLHKWNVDVNIQQIYKQNCELFKQENGLITYESILRLNGVSEQDSKNFFKESEYMSDVDDYFKSLRIK